MGDALGTLDGLYARVRRGMGRRGRRMPAACDAITHSLCKWWPTRVMSRLANRDAHEQVIAALSVVVAKVREDLEHRHGTDPNTLLALDTLLQPVCVEFANLWFSEVAVRAAMRRCCWLARHAE